MSYHDNISYATGVTDAAELREIEDCMRNDIFHSTLDWQTRRVFNKGARDAKELLDYMKSPEGKKYMEEMRNGE